MQNIIDILARTALFAGIRRTEIEELLHQFDLRQTQYDKNAIIQWEQSTVDSIGVLLSGIAVAYRSTASGKQVIMNHLHPSSVFGDILAADPNRSSPVSIRAEENCQVLWIRYASFVGGSATRCSGYARLMHNYIETISRRYFALQDRVACLIMPTLRDKILYCLQEHSGGRRGEPFTIPFDRAGLAAYLNADRSALSRELSLLRKEGLLDYHKNTFKLLG